MGRLPIGKVAMTDAERMRRYRTQRAEQGVTKPVTKHGVAKPVTKSSTGDGTARIRQLEAELARERKLREAAESKASPTTERIAQLGAKLREYSLKIDGLQVQNDRIARAQGGMRADEYNKILKVLHPDRKPSADHVFDLVLELGGFLLGVIPGSRAVMTIVFVAVERP